MLTEIVALANPYTDDLSAGLPVQVFYDNAVRADAQVELFAKSADGSVEITTYRTDANGIATLPVQPGITTWLMPLSCANPTMTWPAKRVRCGKACGPTLPLRCPNNALPDCAAQFADQQQAETGDQDVVESERQIHGILHEV